MAAQDNKEEKVFADLYARAQELLDEDECEEAAALISKLVDKGYPPAMLTWAAFLEGKGHDQEAMELIRKAAGQGHTEAMALLGSKLFARAASEEETQEGREWIHKAAEEGDEIACRMVEFLLFAGDEPSPLSTLAPGGVPLFELAKGLLSEYVQGDMSAAKRHYSHPDLKGVTENYLKELKLHCRVCEKKGSTKLKECSGCKGPRYCSIDCQKKDWPQHKTVCKRNERHCP